MAPLIFIIVLSVLDVMRINIIIILGGYRSLTDFLRNYQNLQQQKIKT